MKVAAVYTGEKRLAARWLGVNARTFPSLQAITQKTSCGFLCLNHGTMLYHFWRSFCSSGTPAEVHAVALYLQPSGEELKDAIASC